MCIEVTEIAAKHDEAAPVLEREALKGVLGSFTTGITIVTARLDGLLHGMTANAFSSVSLDPPLILLCVDHAARMHEFIAQSGAFAVNILSEEQEHLARQFARGGRPLEGEFAAAPYTTGVTGCPLLTGTVGFLECLLHDAFEGGDHTVYLGRVQSASASAERRPLLLHRGQYLTLPADGAVRPGLTLS